MVEAVAVAFSMAWPEGAVQDRAGAKRARAMLAGFRGQLYRCLGRRGDALFELADAVLGKQDRVHMVAELSLEPECRRSHGAVYDALNCGQVRIGRLRRALAGLSLPAWPDGRIRLAVDVSNWLRHVLLAALVIRRTESPFALLGTLAGMYTALDVENPPPRNLEIFWGRMEVEGLGPGKDFTALAGRRTRLGLDQNRTRHSPGIRPADDAHLAVRTVADGVS